MFAQNATFTLYELLQKVTVVQPLVVDDMLNVSDTVLNDMPLQNTMRQLCRCHYAVSIQIVVLHGILCPDMKGLLVGLFPFILCEERKPVVLETSHVQRLLPPVGVAAEGIHLAEGNPEVGILINDMQQAFLRPSWQPLAPGSRAGEWPRQARSRSVRPVLQGRAPARWTYRLQQW